MFAMLTVACAVEPSIKTRVEIPGTAAVQWDAYKEIVLTNFWQEKETKDFDLNKALIEYLRNEIAPQFKGKLSSTTITWDTAEMVNNKEAWKQVVPQPRDRLILTGKAQFTQDLRKALLAKDRRAIDDGPFTPEKAWAERLAFTIKIEFYLINPESGEILLRKDFLEAQDYENSKEPAEFAFSDLMQRIKLKLFRLFFGSERNQERYLLRR
jgi:hypothetical protein